MNQASEQIARQYTQAGLNKKQWGSIGYNAIVDGVIEGGITDTTVQLQELVNKAISEGKRTIFLPHITNGQYFVTALTGTENIDFVGDNSLFVGGFAGTIGNMGGFAALMAETATYGINVKYPPAPLVGAIGDDEADDTAALMAIAAYVKTLTTDIPEIIFPSGTYRYTQSPNWAMNNLRMTGLGNVILKCTGTGKAFILDASPDLVYRYYENLDIKNIVIVGNVNTPDGFYERNIVRSRFENIEVREIEPTAGKAFNILWGVSNIYINPTHTVERSTSMAYDGFFISNTDVGGHVSTNNTIINPIMEGCKIGIRINVGDNNTLIGGTAESCGLYGVVTTVNARANNFIGLALEDNATGDIGEVGVGNQFIGCYTQKDILIQTGSVNAVISGGFHQKITLDAGAINPTIENIWISQFTVGGSIVVNGNGTAKITNVINKQTGVEMYGPYAMSPLRDRTVIAVGASPFTYTNNSKYPQLVNISSGTITSIFWGNAADGDQFEIAGSTTIGSKNGQFLLMPKDYLKVQYTVAPSMNYIPR